VGVLCVPRSCMWMQGLKIPGTSLRQAWQERVHQARDGDWNGLCGHGFYRLLCQGTASPSYNCRSSSSEICSILLCRLNIICVISVMGSMLPCAAGASISYSAYIYIYIPTHTLNQLSHTLSHKHSSSNNTRAYTHTHYIVMQIFIVSLSFLWGSFTRNKNLHVVRFYVSVNIHILQFEHERVYVTIALYSHLLSNTSSLITLRNMSV